MKDVLLVEASEELQHLVSGLEEIGYRVATSSLSEAVEHLENGDLVDAILLSLIEGPDPFAVRDVLRADRVSPRTALLAVLRSEQLAGLDPALTLDDFIVLPVSNEEVDARLRRAMRGREDGSDANQIQCGDLTIDQAGYKAYVENRAIELTYKEYELLRFLALNQDKVCTREMLLNRVWGYDFYGGGRTVDVHIRRLRSKIEDRGHTFIQTVRNVGYRLHVG
jgi:two-component system alkaline phosphatase synthesis response regulator PhoP